MLHHNDPYVRAWTLQFLGNSSKLHAFANTTQSTEVPAPDWVADRFDRLVVMAQQDPSPVVRLYLASLSQRLPFAYRWPILAALAAHAEDVEDNNIARMIWFALEPMVTSEPKKALRLATSGKLPRLNEFVARRLVSGHGQQANSNKKK